LLAFLGDGLGFTDDSQFGSFLRGVLGQTGNSLVDSVGPVLIRFSAYEVKDAHSPDFCLSVEVGWHERERSSLDAGREVKQYSR
jgi:hypothetical protein